MSESEFDDEDLGEIETVAIIGMAGRFPKAPTLDQFWANLAGGVECISHFSDDELEAAGVSALVRESPNFVPARAVLEDAGRFDAAFFAINPSEAEHTDPQQRLFLESSWQALEDAGYDPSRYEGLIGVFAGADVNSYAITNLLLGARGLQTLIGNDKDYLATRVAYKLDLRGPALTLQTACSTSLVAVHTACQSLLSYQCDLALAGGVGVGIPQQGGYLYEEGGILSPDGHCRPFDAAAKGTVGGDGVGVVALKRTSEAREDGDRILAIIKGSAVNNDGSQKVGFTAPSVTGQAEVIAQAQAAAEVSPDTIDYIETHGTGTQLGDPIEISALTDVFRASTERTGFCAIGSLKSNVGHMNSAAGIGALIKTVLALRHRQIPPSLHFESPNPLIDFAASPFYVADRLHDWTRGETPRRAGVSSFGIGGTNAHVILEEAEPAPARPTAPARAVQCLPIAARSREALAQACEQLAAWLEAHPEAALADVAYTLQVGRRWFGHRSVVVAADHGAAIEALRSEAREVTRSEPTSRKVAFLFPGQGSQYPGMGRQLYEREPVFRAEFDRCADALEAKLGLDLRSLVFPPEDADQDEAATKLSETQFTQPALFAFEYALACWWRSLGIEPAAMLGHSIGEYVAACLAGVFSLSDALELVAERGRLMQAQPRGSMLAVALSEAEASALPGVTLAAINGPRSCVVAGPDEAIGALERELGGRGARRLHTSHAFHSPLIEGMAGPFREALSRIALHEPSLAFVSNLSGTWITAAEARDPEYWVKHCMAPVRFAAGVAELARAGGLALVEVGPGRVLSSLARNHGQSELPTITSVRHPRESGEDQARLMHALGELYRADVAIDWAAVHGGPGQRRRVSLPTYPFERELFWSDPQQTLREVFEAKPFYGKIDDPARWLYAPSWRRAAPARAQAGRLAGTTLVFARRTEACAQVLTQLRSRCESLVVAWLDVEFARLDSEDYAHEFTLAPMDRGHYAALLAELSDFGLSPRRVVHLWLLGSDDEPAACARAFDAAQALGYYSLLFLAQALGRLGPSEPIEVDLFATGIAEVTGTETLYPERAPALGALLAMSQEYSHLSGRVFDLDTLGPLGLDAAMTELGSPIEQGLVAFRGRHRWTGDFVPVLVDMPTNDGAANGLPLRRGGTYLITGGLGGIGHTFARHLATAYDANLVLTGRTGLPARAEWDAWLSSHATTNKISLRIDQIKRLEAAGAEVLTFAADVGKPEQMAEVWRGAKARFGRIDGVIHAAGHVGQGLLKPIAEATIDQSQLHFRPKVHGLYTLAELIDEEVEFCLVTSSLAAILGGIGGAAYAAANVFMDAFCHARASSPTATRWLSINWDAWAPHEGSPEAEGPTPAWARFAIEPDEGVAVLGHALASHGWPQLVISTLDLPMRLRQLARAGQDADSEAQAAEAAARHSRPAQNNEYLAPRTELEAQLAEMWEALLGIDKVGVHDNFFKLGGDSLVAIQLGTRLRDTLGLEFSVNSLFDEPTIAGLAERILEAQAEQSEAGESATPEAASETSEAELLAQLDQIENMSEDEVAAMLAKLQAQQD